MAGHAITVQRRIEAPVERVWAVLTDLDHAAEHITAITEAEILTDGPHAVGTTWRETRRMLGRSQTRELCVTNNDPLRRTVIEASSSGADYRTVFVLTARGETVTELSAEFAAESADPSGVQQMLRVVFGPLGHQATARALQRDLDDIAAAATARGPTTDLRCVRPARKAARFSEMTRHPIDGTSADTLLELRGDR